MASLRSDLQFDLIPRKPFQFFRLAWCIFVTSFINIQLITNEISHSQTSHKWSPNNLPLWPLTLKTFSVLSTHITNIATSFFEIPPLNKETSHHTNLVNRWMDKRPDGQTTPKQWLCHPIHSHPTGWRTYKKQNSDNMAAHYNTCSASVLLKSSSKFTEFKRMLVVTKNKLQVCSTNCLCHAATN